MRARPNLPAFVALLIGIALVVLAVGEGLTRAGRESAAERHTLARRAAKEAEVLNDFFARSRAIAKINGHNPAFAAFYSAPGARLTRIRTHGRPIRDTESALAYLSKLFPGMIGEACFIDRSGPENARAVFGRIAPMSQLSPDETHSGFFYPTFALEPGQVYQSAPYISPDTKRWSIGVATPIRMPDGRKPAIVHFEVTIESLRRGAADSSDREDVSVVDSRSGQVIFDTRAPQRPGLLVPLGRPGDRRFASVKGHAAGSGTIVTDGHQASYQPLLWTSDNANRWIVIATSPKATESLAAGFGAPELAALLAGLVLMGVGFATVRASQRELTTAAYGDQLTGLGNRRRLMEDLESARQRATAARPQALAVFDLDGFKGYNDNFGHPAGDALLERLARQLDAAVEDGVAYRMGGDEFCVLAELGTMDADGLARGLANALSARGEGFEITASYGVVELPREASDAAAALRTADQRMYARKHSGRASAGGQSTAVLLRMLSERSPDLGEHLDDVTRLCEAVCRRLGLDETASRPVLKAAALHDVGKAAIPDAILEKPGSLTDEEWSFIRRHTIIGERILGAAPSLSEVARLVRSTHEHFDGRGYPDGLAGQDIPLGARIVSVCDAYDAMVTRRPYRAPMSTEVAVAELRRCAGTQFDPVVVEAFCAAIRELGDGGTRPSSRRAATA